MHALGDTVRFGDLEFTVTTDGELRPAFTLAPVRALRFGSLDFVADKFGALQLSAEESTVERQPELPLDSAFVGVADYASPSLLDILEGVRDDSSGSEAGTDDSVHPSRECNVVGIVDDTTAGEPTGGRPTSPRLTLEQQQLPQREQADRLQARREELASRQALLDQERAELDGEPSTRPSVVRQAQLDKGKAVVIGELSTRQDPSGARARARGLLRHRSYERTGSTPVLPTGEPKRSRGGGNSPGGPRAV